MLLLLLFIASGLHAGEFDAIREEIRRGLLRDNVPSLALAVAKEGRIVWEEGFGWADREHRVSATAHTPYSLASISKPITATALMTLVQAGKVKLDDPINKYLGDAPLVARVGDASHATVRRVANHTSGLPLHYQFFYNTEPFVPPSREETIRRYGKLVTPPGELYEYSNLGYGVLDHVIARVSGRSYEEYLRTEVLAPLGMTRSAVGIPPGLEREVAVRYEPDQRPLPFYDFDHRGGSAIYASAHDLVRFGMFHLKGHLADQKPILTDESIEAMKVTGQASGKDTGYAIGWRVVDRNGRTHVSHTGGMGGVSTILVLAPKERIAFAVLTNTSSRTLSTAIANRLWSEVVEGRQGPAPAIPQNVSSSPSRPPAQLAGVWKGKLVTYSGEQPAELRIDEDGDIRVRFSSQLWSLWDRVSYQNGYLRGYALGSIKTEDALRTRHFLSFSLRLRDGALGGPVSAISEPAPLPGNALTSWVEFRR